MRMFSSPQTQLSYEHYNIQEEETSWLGFVTNKTCLVERTASV